MSRFLCRSVYIYCFSINEFYYELKLCNVLISETRIRFMRLITIFNEILINEVYS
jgi:hypothetical protein